MLALKHDIRYGVRTLRKNPGFTLIAVLTLAVGIGANTAIFSVVNSVLLRPLAYREPQRLYLVREIVPQWEKFYPSLPANLPDFRIWQKECQSFEGIALAEGTEVDLTKNGPAEEIQGVRGSSNLLEVLGVRPALGRAFLPEEDETGRDRVVILTDVAWRSRFHGDPSILSRTIVLDGTPHAVVGVLPPSFHFPKHLGPLTGFAPRIEFLKPLGGVKYYEQSLIGEFDFVAIARLKAGVSTGQALAELNVVQAHIAQEAKEDLDLRAQLLALEPEVVGPARHGLIVFLAAVGAVLLIVCINLANLLLARAPARMREAAIRTALGATRQRLVAQMLIESSLLALAGGVLGIWLAGAGLQWLIHSAPVDLPRLDEVSLDARVLCFALVLSGLSGVFFGTLPAWRIAHADPQESIKSGGTTTEGRRTRRVRQALVTFEVAACTLLLILAGLLTSSLLRLLRVNRGFATERTLAADVQLPPQSYSEAAARQHFYDAALRQILALPGVSSAGWVTILPLEGTGSVSGISLPGQQISPEEQPFAHYRAISPGYFETMGIPLLNGRGFTETDHGRRLVVVSESVAEHFWPGKSAIGQLCIAGWGELQSQPSEVVGVVADIRTLGLDQSPVPMVYVPDSYGVRPAGAPSSASIVVRTNMNPGGVATAVRGVIQAVDPDVPVLAIRPMAEVVSDSISPRRFQMTLALLFALCALFLAALGILGVVGYSVEQRRHELGIRMALGAQSHNILRLVLKEGMTPVVLGFVAGVLFALFTGRVVQSLLFGVKAFDPLTLACVAVAIGLSAFAACYVPARRAMRVDPMVALRYE